MLTTALTFRRPTKEDAPSVSALLGESGKDGCEFSFTTLYMWRELYDTRLAVSGDYLLISSGSGDAQSFLPPIGPSLKEGLSLLKAHVAGAPLRLHGVDEETLAALQEIADVTVVPSPDDYDYVYRTEDLATLPGKAYHSKRNHIAAFSRQFDWRYEELSDDNLSQVLEASKRWCQEKGSCRDHGLRAERCAIREVLSDRHAFGVCGGLILVGDEVAAFALGSPINDRVFDIHTEKALSAYAGAYAVINREFARRLTAYDYLNRENDMGIEGLRRAKQSYRPAILLKKYACEVK